MGFKKPGVTSDTGFFVGLVAETVQRLAEEQETRVRAPPGPLRTDRALTRLVRLSDRILPLQGSEAGSTPARAARDRT